MEEAAFLRAIHADPDSDDVRLVFADWLDEHGDPERAEFVRVQVRQVQPDCVQPESLQVYRRSSELLTTHFPRWTAHLGSIDTQRVSIQFHRGLLAQIDIKNGTSADLEVLFRVNTLRSLSLDGCELTSTVLRQIAALPHLDVLKIRNTPLAETDLALLEAVTSGTVVRLEGTGLPLTAQTEFERRRFERFLGLDPEPRRAALARLARSFVEPDCYSWLRSVGTLTFDRYDASDADLRYLPWFPDLESVSLHWAERVTNVGLRYLANVPGLKSLTLSRSGVTSIEPIVGCRSLERLALESRSDSRLDDVAMQGLEQLTGLCELALTSIWLAERTIERIGSLTRLRTLKLHVGEIRDQNCWRALTHLSQLEQLSVTGYGWDDPLESESLRFLAGLRRLRSLTIGTWDNGSGLRHLAGLTELMRLQLDHAGITEENFVHLAALTKLRCLLATEPEVARTGAEWLATRLPDLTIILWDAVVRSPRSWQPFARCCLRGFVSALLPTRWQEVSEWFYQGSETCRCEEGCETVTEWSVRMQPAKITLEVIDWPETLDVRAVKLEWLANTSQRDRQVLEEDIIAVPGATEATSDVYQTENAQHLLVVFRRGEQFALLHCEVSRSRFAEFRGLFLFVARSLRVGEAANVGVGEEVTVSATEWR